MRHLSTEELLLQCDGELSFARVAHLQGCPLCKAASADLKQLLFEVEQELRATVPQEPVEERLASWLALERTLYPPPRNSGFPIRWPVVYATAAALTVAVFAGYLSTSRQITGRTPQTTISANLPDRPMQQTVPQPVNPADRPFMASAGAVPALGGRLSVSNEGLAAASSVIERAESPLAATDAERQRANPAVSAQERQRFDLNQLSEQSLARADAPPVSAVSQGDLDLRPVLTTEWASVSAPLPAVSRPRPVFDQVQVQTPESAAALVEGHWILAKANVWTEDVRPVWVGNAIQFRGTVENLAVQKLVTAAIEKAAGPSKSFSIDLQLRSRNAEARAATAVTLAADRRPAGGVVRNSLLTHFGDAARRSFISPQPTVLEAEIDRFVTDVFRSQSTLRSHSYALKSLMRSLTPPQVADLDASAAKKFRELVRMHLDAVGAGEQDIYGRLSETLPRRFWSYRAAEGELSDDADWQHESTDLLKEVLQLDATLTALLSTPQSFVDISDSHLSSGELLYRIRSRVHRIRAAAEMAR